MKAMRKLLGRSLVAAGLAFATLGAQAAIIGSTPGGGANPNDVIGAREGWFGANVYLIAGAQTTATLEFLGFEAGETNTFNINGGAVEYSYGGGSANHFPGGTNLINIALDPGLITFAFTTTFNGGGIVTNGSNLTPAQGTPNFFVTFGAQGDSVIDGLTPSSGQVVILALDDGGAGQDDNHDDLVVRITLTNGTFTVPEPISIALLGMGLVGMGAMSSVRRRKSV